MYRFLAFDKDPSSKKQIKMFSWHLKGMLYFMFPAVAKNDYKEEEYKKAEYEREEKDKGNKFKRMTEQKMRPCSGGMGY